MNEKHKLMKPKDPARIGRQASQRAKKWQSRLSAALLCALLFTVFFPSCKDEDLVPSMYSRAEISKTDGTGATTAGLVQQEDGYWIATRRIPLVGVGRIVDNLSGALVSVGPMGNNAPNLVDTDLTNTFSASGIIDAQLLTNQIASIRDLNYIYAGQKAGFVCRSENSSVLSLSVIQGFWLDTYLKGEKQESFVFTKAADVLDLGLGNIAGGSNKSNNVFTVEHDFELPFDEVRIGLNGITADIAGKLEIYYAFVGENPMIPAVNDGNSYFDNNVSYEKWEPWTAYQDVSLKKLIDSDITNGIVIDPISQLFQPHVTVDFGRVVPAGTEVGFYVSSGTVLELGVGATIDVRTFLDADQDGEYDYDKDEQENYSYTQIVGLSLLGGDKTIFSMVTTKECSRVQLGFYGVTVNLGGKQIHYAFIREPDVVDASSYFTMANATVYTPNYRFALPEKGSVKFELIDSPNRAEAIIESGSNILKNMNIAGNYLVRGTYEDENGNIAVQEAVITRVVKKQNYCNNPLVNNDEHPNRFEAYQPEGFNGITIGGGSLEGTLDRVVDNNLDNFIQYNDVKISLIQNKSIIGVKTIDGSTINPEKKPVRVGFIVNQQAPFLGANVLNFARIKLYLKGDEVFKGLVDDNNGVSLSLAGFDGNLARLSIDTNLDFDQIELYQTGLADVSLGETMQVYYAFCENATNDCGYPGEECMQLITNANYAANVTVETAGLASVIPVYMNLGNAVDGDINTYATFVNVVDAADAFQIVGKFNTIAPNQEVGFIISSTTGLTTAGLISVLQIKAYKDGNEVASTTGGGGLGLKLVGNGDRFYASLTPDEEFNELRLILGSGLGVATNFQINGLYIRPDLDNDGVMDCVEDDLSTEITDLTVLTKDICQGGTTDIQVDGGEEGVTYTLKFYDDNNIVSEQSANVTINGSGLLDFEIPNFISTLKPAEYRISVYHGEQEVLNRIGILTVHPTETTWTGKESATWDEWGNWSNGIPWGCTNVILPSSVSRYPVLTAYLSARDKLHCCNNIHFEKNAELIGQHYLDYSQAQVDMELKGGDYHLLSIPMQGVVTGDMFVLEDINRNSWNEWRTNIDENGFHSNYFQAINDVAADIASGKYEEHRINPFIFQRFWSKTVSNTTLSRALNTADPVINNVDITITDWSRTFNAVTTNYTLGQGFAVRAGNQGDNSAYDFHFPKEQTLYHYYNSSGVYTGVEEAIQRDGVFGRLMVDYEDMPLTITLERENSGRLFLFGNPFMAHINIKKFLEVNKNVSGIKAYRYIENDKGYNYEYITASNVSPDAQIAPMEAVFIEVNENSSSTQCSIQLTDKMLEQGNSVSTTAAAPNQLRLTATSRGRSASCVVVPSSVASDDYDAREDATLLVGSEEGSGVAVYTVAGGKALSIQRMNRLKRIPVGFYLKEEGSVSLSFDPQGDAWQGWTLVDSQTGKRYPLDSEISLGTVKSGAGRFYLEAD